MSISKIRKFLKDTQFLKDPGLSAQCQALCQVAENARSLNQVVQFLRHRAGNEAAQKIWKKEISQDQANDLIASASACSSNTKIKIGELSERVLFWEVIALQLISFSGQPDGLQKSKDWLKLLEKQIELGQKLSLVNPGREEEKKP